MSLIIFLLALNFALGSSQISKVDSVLERIEKSISIMNLRLARIEARQTRNMIIYSRLEENIKDVKNNVQSKHGETMLWLKNTVTLLNNLKGLLDEQRKAIVDEVKEHMMYLVGAFSPSCPISTPLTKSDLVDTITELLIPNLKSQHGHMKEEILDRILKMHKDTLNRLKARLEAELKSMNNSPQITEAATTLPTTIATTRKPVLASCKTLDVGGNLKDGVYQQVIADRQISVYCSSGYITLQRRFSGKLTFDRTFDDYEQGFGKVAGEQWLGLKNVYELTKSGRCSMRVLLDIDSTAQWNRDRCGSTSDCDGKTKEILADNFRVTSGSDLYRVYLRFNSTSISHPNARRGILYMNEQQFSSIDKGLQRRDCARGGAVPGGFWYDGGCWPGQPNTVITATYTPRCNTSNKVCGLWSPYHFKSSLMQIRC